MFVVMSALTITIIFKTVLNRVNNFS